jgi:TM2 domain-containing membrane protein YozV
MRMVTADGRGFATRKSDPATLEPAASPEVSRARLVLSYVLLVIGGVFGLHRLYNGQPVLAFAQALFSIYILLDFGTMTSLYLGIILAAWLIADGVSIPKWVAARAGR